jgi:hypothetical protein
MEVIKILDEYPEKDKRKRKWFNIKDASANISVPSISSMILSLETKLKKKN